MDEHIDYSRRFYNPGALGDVVYAIPFCLSCVGILNSSQLRNGEKFDYYLDLCCHYAIIGKDEQFKSLQLLADVLRMQPYIGELHLEKDKSALSGTHALDLGIIRKGRVSMYNGDITRRYRFLRRLPDYFDASTSWLIMDGASDKQYDWLDGKIGVFRSSRHRNVRIPCYSPLKKFSDRLVFFGTNAEHDSFCSQLDVSIPKFDGNFIDICRAFQRCSFIVGNQTFLFSLAEALKVPRLCEMASNKPDVMPLGRMANCFVDNADLEECIGMYVRELNF